MIKKNQPQTVIVLGLIFFVVDRIIKYLFVNEIVSSPSFLVAYFKNYGLAFGINLSNRFLLIHCILITIIILILSHHFIKSYQSRNYIALFSFWLIILGAFSNILDRVKYGFVIDYIDFKIWPVFNIADMMIVGGVIMLILNYRFSRLPSALP